MTLERSKMMRAEEIRHALDRLNIGTYLGAR